MDLMQVELIHTLKTSDETYELQFTKEELRHCTYIMGLMELDSNQAVSVTLGSHLSATDGVSYPIDKCQLDCLKFFIERHSKDAEPMTQEDTEKFSTLDEVENAALNGITGLRIFGLASAAEFIGHKAIMSKFASACSRFLEERNETEIIRDLGLTQDQVVFTEHELAATKAAIPEAFQ